MEIQSCFEQCFGLLLVVAVMSSWDEILEQQLISEGHCVAGGLANTSDCAFYAAAPMQDNAGWYKVWSEEHEQQVQVSEDKFESRKINESAILMEALSNGVAPLGLWFAKNKYKVVSRDADFEVNGKSVVLLFANKPKGGAHVVSTGITVVVGLYDEDLGQSSGNCRRAVLKLAEYLLDNEY